MRIDLSPSQKDIARGAREFFQTEYPPEALRRAWMAEDRDDTLWRKLAAMGFFGLAVPDTLGGLGLGCVELAVVSDEAGRVALAEPMIECTVAATLIGRYGGPDQRHRWLPVLLTGEARPAIQLAGQELVVDAASADVLVTAREGEARLLPTTSMDQVHQDTIDRASSVSTVVFDDRDGDPLGPGASRWMTGLAAALAAAYLTGLSARLLEVTRDYTLDRRQFGRPIGSFQAVKHRLADVATGVEFARPAIWIAAHLLELDDPEAVVAAQVAKSFASRVARLANETALQCHGAIGFTMEHDLHMWLKRGKALEQRYGAPGALERQIAASMFGDGPPSAAPATDDKLESRRTVTA